jgi:cell division protein ZapA (FtsZ GTPase activity inhibitor)
MNIKAARYGMMLSINTSDQEEERRMAHKKIRQSDSVTSELSKATSSSLTVTRGLGTAVMHELAASASTMAAVMASPPSKKAAPKSNKASSSKAIASNEIEPMDITSPLTRPTLTQHQQQPQQQQINNESLPIITQDYFREQLASVSNLFDERMKRLTEQMERNLKVAKGAGDEFIYNGINLVDDIDGKNPAKWALHVVDHLFTQEELRTCVVEHTRRSSRRALSPTRVKLLKKAMVARFDYLKDDRNKEDKAWSIVKDRVNNKGRNIIYRLRDFLRPRENEENNDA